MIKIKLSFPDYGWPILQQTPYNKGIWNCCQFFVNNECDDYDYWIVYDNLKEKLKTKCKCTILITGEPESVKSYDTSFLKQFDYIISCQENLKHDHLIISQEALPWHIGRVQNNHISFAFNKNYDELKNMSSIKKGKLISLIASNKQITDGHQERVKFIHYLKDEFNGTIDFFGRGFNEIGDKWDAIAPYKYHIVLENSSYPNYWSEKLADCYLAEAFPIYYGCTNLKEYFPEGSFEMIDIFNYYNAKNLINKCINESVFEKSMDKIHVCKNLILDKYNLFPMVVDFINSGQINRPNNFSREIILSPENWSFWDNIKIKLIEKFDKNIK
jgi:hypothetical protein